MKLIDIPRNKPGRKPTAFYDNLAEQIKKLPAGKAIPLNGSDSMRANLHTLMKSRGIKIRTAGIATDEFAVYRADKNG
jgi:hypothetical protein